jgi:signal transduction histidine kinase
VKEALNNAARHSRAEQVWLRIAADAREMTVCVEDDGCGFHRPPSEPRHSGGNGVNNMRHRMAQVGGSVEIRPGPGGCGDLGGCGTVVIFRMPLAREWRDAPVA